MQADLHCSHMALTSLSSCDPYVVLTFALIIQHVISMHSTRQVVRGPFYGILLGIYSILLGKIEVLRINILLGKLGKKRSVTHLFYLLLGKC